MVFSKLPKQICLFLILIFIGIDLIAQIDPSEITIARDRWGVPHIYAPTDAGVAYGLAWASAEDDFKSAQVNLLAVRGKLAGVMGKEGAIFDFFASAIKTKELVEAKYETDVSPEFKKVLEGYAAGVNAFAKRYPDQVLAKGVFPIQPQDILQGYVLNLTLFSGVHHDIIKILRDYIQRDMLPQGSNGIAISARKTTNGKTFFASNTHQPLEGPLAWYEAHLESEEGWRMIGANFPGGVTLFVGTTPNLGWTHTINAPDLSDVYKLEMDPRRKGWYKFDGQWEPLKERKFKTKVKLGFLKVPYTRKIYESRYGLTLKGKDGNFYAIRFPANHTIKAAEQWFKMNKATNFKEFKEALAFQGIGATNIIYADREDNILYLGNGNFPFRNPKYNWQKVLPGNTSETLWSPDFFPIDSLAQVVNPPCGWVFNANNQPFNATAPEDNIKVETINKTMGYETVDNNRSLRFPFLMKDYDEVSYQDFTKMKYDQHWMPAPSYSYNMSNVEDLFNMDAQKYPEIREVIELLANWDRSADVNSVGASVFVLVLRKVAKRLDREVRLKEVNIISEAEWVEALTYAQKHLRKYFKTTKVPLGQLQRHIRGEVNMPIGGAPEVLAAIYSRPHKKGQYKVTAGESYIQLVQYSEDGVAAIESVVPYGSSAHEESPHFSDQMEMYAKQQTKPMTFDKEKIMREAVRIYSPGAGK